MARVSPHLITVKRLLKMTGQHADILEIKAKLDRHFRAVARLKKAGYQYDVETGRITPGSSPGSGA